MSKLGHLDRIDAFEFAQYLCLTGGGTNPTLGWTNWFAAIDAVPNIYEFLQEPPTGVILPVDMPFQTTGVFASNGVKEIAVRHLANGKPIDLRVLVRPISRLEEEAMASILPAAVQAYLRNKGSDRTMPEEGASFTMQLGTVDVPFDGGSWNNPQQARRYELHLTVDALVPGAAEIEKAVLECFRRGPVAAILASLLTPAGWANGPEDFNKAIEACLLAALGDRLVNVKVTAPSHCLEGEQRIAQVHQLRPIVPLPEPSWVVRARERC